MNQHRTRTRGFSLLEILIATGIFAGVALAVAGLFSAAHRMEGDSLAEERATLIASGILEGMDRGAAGGFRIATGTSAGSLLWEHVDPLTTSNRSVAYTAGGLPLRPLDPSLSGEPCLEREISDIADIRITHSKGLPALVSVEIDVSTPASAPAAARAVHRYVRQFAEAHR
jgi:prepilin-type N-terminal cleavage/methylation domain-containing protein